MPKSLNEVSMNQPTMQNKKLHCIKTCLKGQRILSAFIFICHADSDVKFASFPPSTGCLEHWKAGIVELNWVLTSVFCPNRYKFMAKHYHLLHSLLSWVISLNAFINMIHEVHKDALLSAFCKYHKKGRTVGFVQDTCVGPLQTIAGFSMCLSALR